mmetsp:Transcript_33343/g.93555  ORF Transcript_33343/g.93555 Transcript_33343/m.93555 type:complete len:460 (+) Transcript_33343:44-1423(+)
MNVTNLDVVVHHLAELGSLRLSTSLDTITLRLDLLDSLVEAVHLVRKAVDLLVGAGLLVAEGTLVGLKLAQAVLHTLVLRLEAGGVAGLVAGGCFGVSQLLLDGLALLGRLLGRLLELLGLASIRVHLFAQAGGLGLRGSLGAGQGLLLRLGPVQGLLELGRLGFELGAEGIQAMDVLHLAVQSLLQGRGLCGLLAELELHVLLVVLGLLQLVLEVRGLGLGDPPGALGAVLLAGQVVDLLAETSQCALQVPLGALQSLLLRAQVVGVLDETLDVLPEPSDLLLRLRSGAGLREELLLQLRRLLLGILGGLGGLGLLLGLRLHTDLQLLRVPGQTLEPLLELVLLRDGVVQHVPDLVQLHGKGLDLVLVLELVVRKVLDLHVEAVHSGHVLHLPVLQFVHLLLELLHLVFLLLQLRVQALLLACRLLPGAGYRLQLLPQLVQLLLERIRFLLRHILAHL